MKNTGLLLIDIQNDYFSGGKMELPGSEHAALMARKLLDFFREQQSPVFHIQHLSIHRGATFFLPGTKGVEIYSAVSPLPNEIVIQKHYPNSFRETGLLQRLQQQGIQKLIVAGMMSQMCVDATVRAATDFGFECWTAQDACAAHDVKMNDQTINASDVHAAFMGALNGTYGRVLNTEQIIARLQSQL
jgi:nicotinamidase-related amidase